MMIRRSERQTRVMHIDVEFSRARARYRLHSSEPHISTMAPMETTVFFCTWVLCLSPKNVVPNPSVARGSFGGAGAETSAVLASRLAPA